MGFTFRSFVNINDRILLYLLNFNHPGEKFGTNDEFDTLTTDGIADAVFTDRNNMSYHIKNLKAHNYIDGLLTHLKGKKRKQMIYFLNEQGRKKADEIKEELKIKQIKIINSGEKIINLKFPEVSAYLEENILYRKITELEICKFANQIGHLDIDNVSKTDERFIDFIEGALKPKYFFGRKKEFEQISTWIDDDESYRFIIVHGIAGIGKTTFASKLIEDYKNNKHLFWHTFNNWDTVRSVLSHLTDFLLQIDDEHFNFFIDFNKPLDLENINELLKQKMKDHNILLIFDDFQKVNDELRDLFASLVENLEKTKKVKIIILTRYNIPFYDQQKVLVRNSVAELEIEGLDFDSSAEILRRKHQPKTKYRDIYDITSGHPLLLEIYEYDKATKRYIFEEIFSKFSDQERMVMERLSMFRTPIPYDAFFIDDNILPDTIDNLIQKLIIKEMPHSLFDSHEFIKEFFYQRLSPHVKLEYHESYGHYYKNQKKPLDHIEAIYHYIKSQQYQLTVELAIQNTQTIIDQGFSERFLSVLDELPEEEIILPQWVDILILKAKLSFINGVWDRSIQYYYRATEIGTEVGTEYKCAKAFCEIGHIFEEQNRFDDALKSFQKSLEISKKIKDKRIIAEAKRGIGRYYWRMTDYDNAEKYFKECLLTFKKLNEYKLIGTIHIDLGNIYYEQYKIAQAIKYLTKALNYLEKVDAKLEIARAHNSLGSLYTNIKDFNKAIECHKKQLDIVEKIGHINLLSYAVSNISYCFAKKNQIQEAEVYIKRAKTIFEMTNNENVLFTILKTEGLINQHYKNWDKAIECFKKSIAIVEKLDVPFYLAETLFELSSLYDSKNDPVKARIYYEQAQQLKENLINSK